MNDAIGSEGMLRGWIMLWQMQLVWLLPMLVVSAAVVTLVKLVVSMRSPGLPVGNLQSASERTASIIQLRLAAVSHETTTAMADLYPKFSLGRSAPDYVYRVGPVGIHSSPYWDPTLETRWRTDLPDEPPIA